MLLQHNSGATDLYIQIFQIFISHAIWIFMANAKGVFSNSEDHNKKNGFYFLFLSFNFWATVFVSQFLMMTFIVEEIGGT